MTTRFERIISALTEYNLGVQDDGIPDTEDTARKILAIADDREIWSPKECADWIGREQPVWANWQKRRTHDVPAPAFTTGTGALYDAQDVREWAVDHPGLLGESSAGLDHVRAQENGR